MKSFGYLLIALMCASACTASFWRQWWAFHFPYTSSRGPYRSAFPLRLNYNYNVPPPPLLEPDPPKSSYRVVCYFESYAYARPGIATYNANNIDPFLCTHINYAFAILDPETYTIVSGDPAADIDGGGFFNITSLRQKNPNLQILISIGGWGDGGHKYSTMSRLPELRANFIQSVVNFLNKFGFQGIDLDWEYPGAKDRGGRCEDKDNFVKLVKELRQAFEPYGFLLTAAITPKPDIAEKAYNIPELNKYLDFFNVMTYDLHNLNLTTADHHSPFGRQPTRSGTTLNYNVESSIQYLLDKGAEPYKLILGIPFYGRSFKLADPDKNTPGSEAKGAGEPGPFLNSAGYLAYYEICPGIIEGSWSVLRDEYIKSPYAYKGDQWVGYDDDISIDIKMEFVKRQQLGGAMIWAITTDDFRGVCGEKSSLLLRIFSSLCGSEIQPNYNNEDAEPVPQDPIRIKPGSMAPPADSEEYALTYESDNKQQSSHIMRFPIITELIPPSDFSTSICKRDGFHSDPDNCSKYYSCANGTLRHYSCPEGLAFNGFTFTCDWHGRAQCIKPEKRPPALDGLSYSLFACPSQDGFFHDPADCDHYYACAHGQPVHFACPPGTSYDVNKKYCNHKHLVDCNIAPPEDYPEPIVPVEVTTPFVHTHPPITEVYPPQHVVTPAVSPTRPPIITQPAIFPPVADGDFKVVCYFTNWAWYRPGDGKYVPEDVDVELCTHVIYAFTVLNGEALTLKPHDPWADIDNHFFERFVALKKKNPTIKTILGLGGWTDSAGDKYSRLVNNPSSRQNFIQNALQFIDKYGFDGLDFDWEYPKCWQVDCDKGPESDKAGFTAMLQELRQAFDNHTPRLLLTAALSPSKTVIDFAYDVPELAKTLDFFNVMTYDYHGSWEKFTGHVAPLYYYPGDQPETFNANFTMHYFMELGAPRNKLIMGMPFYGQTWTLASANENGIRAPTYGPGEAGTYSRQGGMMSYYEICHKLAKEDWTVVKDPKGRIGPFAVKGTQWMSFDDAETIQRKAEYVRDNKFGGAMHWALDFDDFRNLCCTGKSPLLKTINRVLRNYQRYDSNAGCGVLKYKEVLDGEPIQSQAYFAQTGGHAPISPPKVCITSRCLF